MNEQEYLVPRQPKGRIILSTLVYYHPEFELSGYPILKSRLAPSFNYLKQFVQQNCSSSSISFLEPPSIDLDLLKRVHTDRHIASVKASSFYPSALLSAGGAVEAAKAVWKNNHVENAFVFTGTAGHHASKDHAWGFCYFNNTALALEGLWTTEPEFRRVTVVDTDPHPGDGTQDCLGDKDGFQHFNFQSYGTISQSGEIWDIGLPSNCGDEAFILALKSIKKQIIRFHPDMLIWNIGHDAHEADYGGFRLSLHAFPQMCEFLLYIAQEVCKGRLLVLLSGGSEEQIAKSVISSIVAKLAKCPALPPIEERPTSDNIQLLNEVNSILKKLKLE